jgi:hypothetical protein
MDRFLFHEGNNVRITKHHLLILRDVEARVECIVVSNEELHCPHCDKRKKHIFEKNKVMYYLSIPHPIDCCLPFSAYQLDLCDAVTEYITYDNLMKNLKEI